MYVRFSKLLVAIFFIISPYANAKDLGVHGTIYEISEEDFLKAIEASINKLEEDGELDKLNEQFRDRSVKTVMRPPSVDLPKAVIDRTFYYDPAIVVQEDIKDHKGNLIAYKGQIVNPFDTFDFKTKMVFFDADDEAQLSFALDQYYSWDHNVMLILTNGSPIERMRETEIRMYFDQGGYLTRTFGLKAVPAVLYREGEFLKGKEFVLHPSSLDEEQ